MADKKPENLSPDTGRSLEKVLQAVEEALHDAGTPISPAIDADEETKKKLDTLIVEIAAIKEFALAIAQGDLSPNLDADGYMAGSLKTLQSNLRHLTWQTRQIADGDFSQRVHFMGEFSDSFNTMVEHLSEEKACHIKREEEKRLTSERFETLLKISTMRSSTEKELSQFVMQAACRMTGSTIAFIGTLDAEESAMDIISWSKSAMKDCNVALSPVHFPVNKAGIWAEAVRRRKATIVNDYFAPAPGKKGLPKGHIEIIRLLSIPVLENGKVVMIAAVANKPENYSEADVTRLTLLMEGVWGNIRRRRAEKALKESEYRFRELFNSLNSGVAVLRCVNDGEDFEIVDFNHGGETIENLKKQDVIGKCVSRAFPGVKEMGLIEIFRRVWLTGKSEHQPTSLYRTENAVRWRENYVYRLPSMELVAIYDDVTERVQAEKFLREANNKLNMLSSITRHDILNMIMVIRGYIELSEYLEKDPVMLGYIEKEKEAVDAIQEQIEFTRYYQDIGLKEPTWHNAEKLADSAAKMLDLKQIKFENLLSGLEIFADHLIEKVFYNLTENSLRHGGDVTSIVFSYLENDDGLVISYRDNGAGISGEDKKKLFTKGFGKHTGLGLFLSREILSITNIEITENGTEGKGVNFEIKVPKGSFRFAEVS